MSMHLHHPSLSLSGKKKGKTKFASSAAKKRQQELSKSWQENMKQWDSMSLRNSKKVKLSTHTPSMQLSPKIPVGRDTRHIPSVDTGIKGAVSSKPPQIYTGTKIIGIGTLHKSNAIPVFSDEEAKDIARMRRG